MGGRSPARRQGPAVKAWLTLPEASSYRSPRPPYPLVPPGLAGLVGGLLWPGSACPARRKWGQTPPQGPGAGS